MTRRASIETVASALQAIFGELLGISPASIGSGTSFLELGADSLLLMRAVQAIDDRLSVRVPFRDLLGQYTCIESLSAFVLANGGVDHGANRATDGGSAAGPGQERAKRLESELPDAQLKDLTTLTTVTRNYPEAAR